MKVAVETGSLYPYYLLTTEAEVDGLDLTDKSWWASQLMYEVDGRTLRRWQRVTEEFHLVQAEMAKLEDVK